ncbi:MAG: hypothetical protein WC877_00185 [Dehalococcoidales bacterium]|jgi:hypothetical protein
MDSKIRLSDRIELYRIDDKEWNLEVKTNHSPTFLQKLLCKLKLYNYADDALTNQAVYELATHFASTYTYVDVGTDGTDGGNYEFASLKVPTTIGRTNAVITYENTYSTNLLYPDTVVYTAVMTSDDDYILQESGLFEFASGGIMGARQTFYDWNVTAGEEFAFVWKVVFGRD